MIASMFLAWGVILFLGWIVCWVSDRIEARENEQEGNGKLTPADPWEWTWHD